MILLYGAPNYTKSTDKDTEFGYEGATQVLIWEIVMGLRSSTSPYSRNDRRLYDTFAGGDFPSFDTGYAQIVKLMQAHLTIPSFASAKQEGAPEITLKYDAGSNLYKASVTDTNGVLASDYTFTASGVTINKSGNTLNISAPLSALANGSVLASATGRSLDAGNMAYMIWTASGKQTVTTVTTSANPVKAYFKVKADAIPGTATVRKTTDSGDVEGYCFKIYRWDSNTSWYGKTDGDGNLYLTDSAYSQSGTKTYTFSNLLDGEYTFLEVLSQKGAGLVFPDSWNITVTNKAGKTVYDRTFTAADFTTDDNGDCRLDRVSITGLTGGGNMTMTIHNAPVPADLEILKTSEDGKVSGITFTVEEWAPGIGYCRIGRYTTDGSGKILVPKLYVGTKYRLTETVPEGYIGEAPKEITIQEGTNTVTFENRPIYGSLELTKINESNPETKLSGAEFTVTWPDGSTVTMPEELDGAGDGTGVYRLGDLPYGSYTIRETKAPEGYELSNEVFTIDITEDGKTYTVSSSGFDGVTNRQQVGSIQVKKVDPEGNPLAGVSFLLEYSQDGKGWKSVTFREEGSLPEVGSCTSSGLKDSILTTAEDGIAMFSGLSISIGDNHIYYLLTETTVPEGYTLLPEPAFEGELPQDGSREITVTAVNSSQYMLPFTGNI
ncbi:MAG: SpaA isopeptide-forming pilin-related protein [Oscillospiraceae bacterium]